LKIKYTITQIFIDGYNYFIYYHEITFITDENRPAILSETNVF